MLNTAGVVVQLPDATSAQLLGAAGFGNDGISAWGAFKDTSGAVVHYAVGLPVDITPKTATYALALPQMATRPTDAQGNVVGSLLSWNQAVDFINKWGTASAAWEVQGVQLDAQLSGPFDVGMSGQCAATSCFVNARGLPVGPRAQGFMVAYLLNYFPSPTRESPKPVDISARGTAVLTQTSAQ